MSLVERIQAKPSTGIWGLLGKLDVEGQSVFYSAWELLQGDGSKYCSGIGVVSDDNAAYWSEQIERMAPADAAYVFSNEEDLQEQADTAGHSINQFLTSMKATYGNGAISNALVTLKDCEDANDISKVYGTLKNELADNTALNERIYTRVAGNVVEMAHQEHEKGNYEQAFQLMSGLEEFCIAVCDYKTFKHRALTKAYEQDCMELPNVSQDPYLKELDSGDDYLWDI